MRFRHIGQQLREYRIKSGLTADAIAARLGVSRAAVYRYERGDIVKLETITRMAELFGVSLCTLLDDDRIYLFNLYEYFERVHEIESNSRYLYFLGGPLFPLITSENFDRLFVYRSDNSFLEKDGADILEGCLRINSKRKLSFQGKNLNVLVVLSEYKIRAFLDYFRKLQKFTDKENNLTTSIVLDEVRKLVDIMKSPCSGIEIGVIESFYIGMSFEIVETIDNKYVILNPIDIYSCRNIPDVSWIDANRNFVSIFRNFADHFWTIARKKRQGVDILEGIISEYMRPMEI